MDVVYASAIAVLGTLLGTFAQPLVRQFTDWRRGKARATTSRKDAVENVIVAMFAATAAKSRGAIAGDREERAALNVAVVRLVRVLNKGEQNIAELVKYVWAKAYDGPDGDAYVSELSDQLFRWLRGEWAADDMRPFEIEPKRDGFYTVLFIDWPVEAFAAPRVSG